MDFGGVKISFPPKIPQSVIQALRAKGFEMKPVRDDIRRVNGIAFDPASGFRLGGAVKQDSA